MDQLLKDGYTDFVVLNGYDPFTMKKQINIHTKKPPSNEVIRMGGNPSLIFKQNGKIAYLVIDGSLIKL